MSELLQFTDAALTYIRGKLSQQQGHGFRVSVRKTGCSGYKYEPSVVNEAVSGDLHFMAGDLPIYIDPACAEMLTGLTVDFVEENKEGNLKQKKLVFINPNEKSRCGCGESFHV